MEKLNFSDCTLARMEETFGLIALETMPTLSEWMATEFELSDFDRESVRRLCKTLNKNAAHWNEYDLSLHFIGPMFSLVDFTERYRFNLFAQRSIFATVQGIELGGRTDELIATGFRSPKIPFFAFNEYKKETDPDGDPAGQALAAMLVGQELNAKQGNDFPIYGCYIVGASWRFIVLAGNEYIISSTYDGVNHDDALQILRILYQLKELFMARTAHIVVAGA
jgi:hypothetical protein